MKEEWDQERLERLAARARELAGQYPRVLSDAKEASDTLWEYARDLALPKHEFERLFTGILVTEGMYYDLWWGKRP